VLFPTPGSDCSFSTSINARKGTEHVIRGTRSFPLRLHFCCAHPPDDSGIFLTLAARVRSPPTPHRQNPPGVPDLGASLLCPWQLCDPGCIAFPLCGFISSVSDADSDRPSPEVSKTGLPLSPANYWDLVIVTSEISRIISQMRRKAALQPGSELKKENVF
jgi:hypothetical protein